MPHLRKAILILGLTNGNFNALTEEEAQAVKKMINDLYLFCFDNGIGDETLGEWEVNLN